MPATNENTMKRNEYLTSAGQALGGERPLHVPYYYE